MAKTILAKHFQKMKFGNGNLKNAKTHFFAPIPSEANLFVQTLLIGRKSQNSARKANWIVQAQNARNEPKNRFL